MKAPLPVDGGWAWCIMVGAFVNMLAPFLFVRALSILFIEFLDKFEESATMTTLTFALSTAFFSLSSMFVPTLLLPRLHARTVAITGAVMNAAAILGLAFCPSLMWLHPLFALLGFSHPLMHVSQVALLGKYFRKRISFSVAFTNLGMSLATMAGPPLSRFLLDQYGLQGTLLILGAINMHCIASCFLFRPPSYYADPASSVSEDSFISSLDADQPVEVVVTDSTADGNPGVLVGNPVDVQISPEKKNLSTERELPFANDEEGFPKGSDLLLKQLERVKSSSESHLNSKEARSTQLEQSLFSSTCHVKPLKSDDLVADVITAVSKSGSIRYLSSSSMGPAAVILSARGISPKASTCRHDFESEFESQKLMQENEKEKDASTFSGSALAMPRASARGWLVNTLQNSVYSRPTAIMLVLAGGLGVNTQCAATYLPSLGLENGMAPSQIPFLLTVAGATDFLKLPIGHLADLGIVRRIAIPCITQFALGVAFQLAVFFRGPALMGLLAATLGGTSEVTHVMLPSLTLELLGEEHIGHVVSGYYLLNGVIMSLSHVVVGALKDQTGSFVTAYNFLGTLILAGGVCLLGQPAFAKCDGSRVKGQIKKPGRE